MDQWLQTIYAFSVAVGVIGTLILQIMAKIDAAKAARQARADAAAAVIASAHAQGAASAASAAASAAVTRVDKAEEAVKVEAAKIKTALAASDKVKNEKLDRVMEAVTAKRDG